MPNEHFDSNSSEILYFTQYVTKLYSRFQLTGAWWFAAACYSHFLSNKFYEIICIYL